MANYDPMEGRRNENFMRKFKLRIPPVLKKVESTFEIGTLELLEVNSSFHNEPPLIKVGLEHVEISEPIINDRISQLSITTPIMRKVSSTFEAPMPKMRNNKNNTTFNKSEPVISFNRENITYEQSVPVMHEFKDGTLSHLTPGTVKQSIESTLTWETPMIREQKHDKLEQAEPVRMDKKDSLFEHSKPVMIVEKESVLEQSEPVLSNDKEDTFEMENEAMMKLNWEEDSLFVHNQPLIDIRQDDLKKTQPLIDIRPSTLLHPSPFLYLNLVTFTHLLPYLLDVPSSLEHANIEELSREFELIHPAPLRFEKPVSYMRPDPELVILPDEFFITTPQLLEDE